MLRVKLVALPLFAVLACCAADTQPEPDAGTATVVCDVTVRHESPIAIHLATDGRWVEATVGWAGRSAMHGAWNKTQVDIDTVPPDDGGWVTVWLDGDTIHVESWEPTNPVNPEAWTVPTAGHCTLPIVQI